MFPLTIAPANRARSMLVWPSFSVTIHVRLATTTASNESCAKDKAGDPVETWLNGLLCLDASKIQPISSGCPVPQDCELYYINRDTLFCYHKASEMFLQRLMSLYVASHYKNTPNDLQMLSDAPAHHLFCLLPPIDPNKTSLPEVLCVLQVCLEGVISRSSVQTGLTQGKRAAGDLIPWTIAQQFQDEEFPRLAGARVVRIATHPDYQGMGYGSRALDLLERYFVGEMVSLTDVSSSPSKKKKEEEIRALNDENQLLIFREEIAPRNDLPPLLTKLSERKPEALDYLGVSYGVTAPLLKFWKKSGFVPVYLRQTANELTGEHSCIMLKQLVPPDAEKDSHEQSWLRMFWTDFQRRFISLLGFSFRSFSPQLALGILQNNSPLIIESTEPTVPLSKQELLFHLSPYDIKRLDLYARNMADYHLITDLLPAITRMYFTRQLAGIHLSAAQAAIFAGLGLQRKAVDKLSSELDLEPSQLLGLFNRSVKKIVVHLNEILETAVEKSLEISGTGDRSIGDKMSPLKISLEKNLKRSGGENSDSWKKKKKKKFQKQ
ncbi:unnamed protein product [Cyprideis torosa]|uniref:Uncharacterized protein n=1 Tax=Cyprideis torosa TaxID=163714 RepID=A0A7R8WID6_9CRUS|nr:unnamed protein product [Cyprideis torosa]CAG0894582.1 unnamed protein product [Cyprideis torosa]